MSEKGRRDLPIRDDLRGLTAYGAPQLDVAVRLNTNESPHPPPPAVVAALRHALGSVAAGLNRYPDRDASALRADLAAYLGHGLDAAQVWAANGSNEVLQQLLQLFGGPGRTALGFEPGYAMHRLIARTTGTGWAAADRRADFALPADHAVAAIAGHRPDVVLLCSPNNPTGTALDLDVIARAYDAAQQGGPSVVVVDEAYAEFSARPSALGLLPGRPLLVVTRTMSKAFALAGARVGYLAAAPEVVAALQLVRLPYHLSALTQTAARVALAFAGELLGAVEALKAQRDRLVVELRGLGLSVVDSDANFVLFGRFADQAAVWRALLDRGVLVRDVGLDGWLRVTAGTQPETDAFLAAMRDALQAAA